MGLRIKSAIINFNDNRKEGQPKMTQKSLGLTVLPGTNEKTVAYYISQWSDGKQEGKLKPEQILLIKEETGVSLDFLFGINK